MTVDLMIFFIMLVPLIWIVGTVAAYILIPLVVLLVDWYRALDYKFRSRPGPRGEQGEA